MAGSVKAVASKNLDWRSARVAGDELRRRGELARAAAYDPRGRRLRIELITGVILLVPVERVEGLAGAPARDLCKVRVDGAGICLHWPTLDVDLSVPNLVSGIFGSKAWMSALARHAGRTTSPAKAAAARRNGRKGGRPRKSATAKG